VLEGLADGITCTSWWYVSLPLQGQLTRLSDSLEQELISATTLYGSACKTSIEQEIQFMLILAQ